MIIDDMPAGRELDAFVAERVMGIPIAWYTYTPNNVRLLVKKGFDGNEWDAASVEADVPNYSSDIAAAWQVVEKLDLLREYILTKNEDGKYIICLFGSVGDWSDYYKGASESVSLAICRAALRGWGDARIGM